MSAAGLVAAALPAGAAAGPIGIVAHARADAPVPPNQTAQGLAAAARAAGAEVSLAPFARAQERLAQGAVPAERLRGFHRAQALAAAGWRAYLAVEPAAAAAELERARSAALAVLDLQSGPVLYADIALRLGVVLHQLGRANEADEVMRLAALLDPERDVSIAEFAPDVVSAYEAARTASKAAVTLRIHTWPAGAAIELDGQPAGTAPVSMTVSAGQHVVVARATGYRSQGQVIAVAPGQAAIELALEPDPWTAAVARGNQALLPGQPAREISAAVQGLLRYAELEAMVLVASVWRRGAPALLGQRCQARARRPLGCTRVIEIGYGRPQDVDKAAAELWAALEAALASELPSAGPSLLADARMLAAETRPGSQASQARACRWCRSRWLWLGVGAAAVTAAALWALSVDQDSMPVVVVDPCMFGGCAP